MKKFFFSLHTVLNVKELEKEKKINELSKLTSDLLSLQKEKDTLIKFIEIEKQAFFSSVKKYSVSEIIFNKEYIESIYKKIKVVDNEILKLSFEEKEVTNMVIKFTKEINVLNKIKESKRLEYNAKCQAEEDKMLQEMIQTKHINKKT